jgi:hypothetical protein
LTVPNARGGFAGADHRPDDRADDRPVRAAAWPRPVRPLLAPGLAYRVQRLLEPNPFYRWLARRLDASPAGYRLVTRTEKAAKGAIFGCRMCGQCTLPVTGYACPVTCPKQLRNGPCGGVGTDGSCEVFPGMRCVWLVAYERAEQQGRGGDLRTLQRPIDHRLWGQSSWVNHWQGRDEQLWAHDSGGEAPAIWRSAASLTAGTQ